MLFAISFLLTNVAATHVQDDVQSLRRILLNDNVAKKVFWICLVFVATRDVTVSVFVGILLNVVMELLNDSKRYFILRDEKDKTARYVMNKQLCRA